VIERLGEVFGPCGVGWRYVHSPFEELVSDRGHVEVITEVALQYCHPEGSIHAVILDGSGWAVKPERTQDWREPVFACGGSDGLTDPAASLLLSDADLLGLGVRAANPSGAWG
jgi:hypothetical protein